MGTITRSNTSIDEGFEAGGTRVTPLPSASARIVRSRPYPRGREAIIDGLFFCSSERLGIQRPSVLLASGAASASAR